IRFAEKQGISVRIAADRSDFVRAYEVYLAWRDTERKEVIGQCHSFETFVEPLRLVQNRRLFLAELSGKAIAINVFRYYPGGLFESAANSSVDEFLPLKPNDLLQWKGIEWACRQGLRRHSLGGAHPFLTRFGGALVPIVRYRVDHTLLRRHDLREMLRDTARRRLRQLSPSVQGRVRRALGRLDGQ
ncbi:MAG TPA: GNAT family N-acetyltransferase, partial [Candidatus Methylomirabilis sp.]|nr:GNAT family N-acetyltransferase [Candidatus Methylomirabilis sp.]